MEECKYEIIVETIFKMGFKKHKNKYIFNEYVITMLNGRFILTNKFKIQIVNLPLNNFYFGDIIDELKNYDRIS